MDGTALKEFEAGVRDGWGALTTGLVDACRRRMQTLLRASMGEPWLAALRRDMPESEELCRDPEHGFVLQAHTEAGGRYRPPHDHGRSWVIYGVQHGEVEMGAYARVEDADGRVRLVRRSLTRMRAGDAQVYLPGDIHDTRCLGEHALLFRFTERDLRIEDRVQGRVTRYVERNGVWTPPEAA